MARSKRTTANHRTSISESEGALIAQRVATKDKSKHSKRETNKERLQRVVGEMKRHSRCSVGPSQQRFEYLLREMEGILERCTPIVLQDKGIQRTLRKAERDLKKSERVFRDFARGSLFHAADLFAEIVKTRRGNKTELTALDMDVFQQSFLEFRDNFPEFLRMVADILEGKTLRVNQYAYDNEIRAAYKEAWKRLNAWRVDAVPDWKLLPSEYRNTVQELSGSGVLPAFSEFSDIFREQNPKLFEPRKDRPDGTAPSERSLRRSLERLGLVTRPVKRGPK